MQNDEKIPIAKLKTGKVYLCILPDYTGIKPFYFTISEGDINGNRVYCEIVNRFGVWETGMREGKYKIYSFYSYYEIGSKTEENFFYYGR